MRQANVATIGSPSAARERAAPGRRPSRRSPPRRWSGLLLLFLAASLTACFATVKVKRAPRPEPAAERGLELAALSRRTQQTLRLLHLDARLEENPLVALAQLHGAQRTAAEPEVAASLAELLLATAELAVEREPEAAAGLYLLAAARAHDYLFAGGPPSLARAFDSRLAEMRDVYNRALGAYVAHLKAAAGGVRDHPRETPYERFAVRVAAGPGLLDPEACEAILLADQLEVRGLRNHYSRDGLGAMLVTVREHRHEHPRGRFYPHDGVIDPATVLADFAPPAGPPGSEVTAVTLSFVDPREVDAVEIAGFRVPVAADFTTPYAYLASLSNPRQLALGGMIEPERLRERQGLFLLQPYDPAKIPLLMVHGLRSSPLAWMELTNDLFGDPELRRRFQVWQFLYPTALPYLHSGALLRAALDDVRATFDPEGDDPATASMVVVAHSMGGLLAKTLVAESGSRIWDALSTAPPEALHGTPEDVAWLHRMFVFSPRPDVRRVVFISTPHRGSEAAAGVLGRISSTLVGLPEPFTERIERLVAANRELIRPEILELLDKGAPDSIRSLRPDRPLLRILAELPIAPGVEFHTILGDRGKGAEEPVSDGYVTYESAHLEGAVSERLVPSGHAAYAHPLAIAEIMRILRHHLAAAAPPAADPGAGPATGDAEWGPFDPPPSP